MRALTEDRFYGGRLVVCQHRDGYRFSIDAALLAAFVRTAPEARVVDLGCGCGIVALLMAFLEPSCRVVGVEIQPGLATLAKTNVARNRLEGRITILEKDLRQLQRRHCGPVDLVVANPPFRPAGSGRINPDEERAGARHEILGTLADFVSAGRRLLNPGGSLMLIYPASRGVDLILTLRKAGLEPKYLRLVHTRPGSGARLILVRALKGAGPALEVGPPLFVYQAPGQYGQEVAAMLDPSSGV
jgi:tRNA1Val (adenine37-N6)-methyltransferase